MILYFYFVKIMNLYYYLNELKLRFFYIILCFFITFFTCIINSEKIMYTMLKPFVIYIKNNNVLLHNNLYTNKCIDFIFIDLYEYIYTNIFISFFCSFYLIIPIIMYQLWCFFSPSIFYLYKKNIFILCVFFLFLIFLCIYLINIFFLQKILYFFLNYNINNTNININYMPRLKSYIYVYIKLVFFSFFICVMPFLFFFFIKLYNNFFKIIYTNRFKNFFFILLITSIIVPPDIFSHFLVCIFVNIFLEFFILFYFIFNKFNNKKTKF